MTQHLDSAKNLLAGAVRCPVEEVPDDASIKSWSDWESLAHMRLILALEAHTGAEIPPDRVVEITTLTDVVDYLSSMVR